MTSGDTILVLVTAFCYPGLDCSPTTQVGSDVTDSLGDTFTFMAHQGSRYFGTDVFTATASAAGYPTVQVTLAGGVVDADEGIMEFSDVGLFDASGYGSESSDGIFTSTVTTTSTGDTLIAVNGMISTGSSADVTQIDPGAWTTVPFSHQFWDAYVGIEYATSYAPVAGVYTERVYGHGLGGLNATGNSVIFAFKPTVSPRPTSGPPHFRYESVIDEPLQLQPLYGLSTSLGGGALGAGACASTTVAVQGALLSMQVGVTPETSPGDAFFWKGYVSAPNVVTVKVCAAAAGTPTASLYDVRVTK
jgi:hypothetical protein